MSSVTVRSEKPSQAPQPGSGTPIPPLENGDRLTRTEFERRYDAMPRLKGAELIEGVVHMPSPVRFQGHGWPHLLLTTWIGYYVVSTPGTLGADNASARLDLDNEPQPDVLLMIDPAKGGQAKISDDDYVEGAPELVCEIASSSVSYDLHVKKNVYRRCGVREYVVWRAQDGEVDWFLQRDGEFERQQPDAAGVYRSRLFAGLWLDAGALRGNNPAKLNACLNEGLAAAEHAAFATRLRS